MTVVRGNGCSLMLIILCTCYPILTNKLLPDILICPLELKCNTKMNLMILFFFTKLFMIPELRKGILAVEGAALHEDDEMMEPEDKFETGQRPRVTEQNSTADESKEDEKDKDREKDSPSQDKGKSKDQERKEYQVNVLRQLQFIFGHLAESQLQFHVPRGFWKTFK